MSKFHTVGPVAEYPDPSSTLVEVDDTPVLLVHAAGRFYAIDDVCTHDGGPLSDGGLDTDEPSIACPRHGARFSLTSGEAMTMPATKATVVHDVRVDGDQVAVRLAD